ncbi:MAG: hypothetical protein J6R59_02605 [Paludibacteraceae bacterium]|nr:hypothetical protein [Paludibacteraceae bacterium]
MFKGCSLSYDSLRNIIKSVPSVTGDDKKIDITVADSAKYEMGGDERFIGAVIPRFNDGSYFSLNHNGWELRLTSTSGFTVEVNEDMTFSIHVSKTYETTGNPNVSIGIAINSSSVKPGEQTTATISVTDFYKTNGQNKPSYQSVTISFDGSGKLTQDIPIQINQIGPVVINGE